MSLDHAPEIRALLVGLSAQYGVDYVRFQDTLESVLGVSLLRKLVALTVDDLVRAKVPLAKAKHILAAARPTAPAASIKKSFSPWLLHPDDFATIPTRESLPAPVRNF
jgi:hypothetical protein